MKHNNVNHYYSDLFLLSGATSLASPALRTPGMAGRITSVNDDEAERRKRRLETHMRTMMSPGCHTPTNAAAGTDIDR